MNKSTHSDHRKPERQKPTLPGDFKFPDGYSPQHDHGQQTTFTSVRTTTHRGSNIRIETTYKIEIDDRPVVTHTTVSDDGKVRSHGLPNYSFTSAIDLAKKIVDSMSLVRRPKNELGEPERD